jgi:LPXTG-motif cell wall-anchored protein
MLLDIVADPPTDPTYLLVAGSLLALTVLWLVWRKRRGSRADG